MAISGDHEAEASADNADTILSHLHSLLDVA
jgi:hypothetical protein